MRMRIAVCLATGVGAIGLFGASPASAATEFGDACVATTTIPLPLTIFEQAAAENPMPVAAPVGGVLTRWKLSRSEPVTFAIPITLKVLRLGAGTVTVTGESDGAVVNGANSFPARVPVAPGDRLGIFGGGEVGSLLCSSPQENLLGLAAGGPAPGSTVAFESDGSKARVPLVGVIEADVDNDGYGDESQDGCPQSAAYHSACPVVRVDAFATAGRRAVRVLVATSLTAPVKVSGSVKLDNGGKAVINAPRKTVTAGKLTAFTMKFPGSVLTELEQRGPGQKLTLKVTASATNIVGPFSTDKLNAKLKGRG